MKPFCEIIVQNVLPTVRALVAKGLIENHRLTQEAVAIKLGTTQPAVSQYIRDLRGSKIKTIEKDDEIIKEIEGISNRIASGELNSFSATKEFCGICKNIRTKKLICNICGFKKEDIEEKCNLCQDVC